MKLHEILQSPSTKDEAKATSSYIYSVNVNVYTRQCPIYIHIVGSVHHGHDHSGHRPTCDNALLH